MRDRHLHFRPQGLTLMWEQSNNNISSKCTYTGCWYPSALRSMCNPSMGYLPLLTHVLFPSYSKWACSPQSSSTWSHGIPKSVENTNINWGHVEGGGVVCCGSLIGEEVTRIWNAMKCMYPIVYGRCLRLSRFTNTTLRHAVWPLCRQYWAVGVV